MTTISKVGGSGGQKGPPPDIQAQLDRYGLQPQGSPEADKAAIAAARAQQQSQNQQANNQQGDKTKPNGPPPGPPPEIMQQLMALGLQPQGSLQADLAAINNAKAQSGQGNNLNLTA